MMTQVWAVMGTQKPTYLRAGLIWKRVQKRQTVSMQRYRRGFAGR